MGLVDILLFMFKDDRLDKPFISKFGNEILNNPESKKSYIDAEKRLTDYGGEQVFVHNGKEYVMESPGWGGKNKYDPFKNKGSVF